MTEPLTTLSIADSKALAARQRSRNRIFLVVLLLLVAGMLALSAWHVRVEMHGRANAVTEFPLA